MKWYQKGRLAKCNIPVLEYHKRTQVVSQLAEVCWGILIKSSQSLIFLIQTRSLNTRLTGMGVGKRNSGVSWPACESLVDLWRMLTRWMLYQGGRHKPSSLSLVLPCTYLAQHSSPSNRTHPSSRHLLHHLIRIPLANGDSFTRLPVLSSPTYRHVERQVAGGGGFPRGLMDAAALGEYALPARRRLLLLEASPLAARKLDHCMVFGGKVLWASSCGYDKGING